MSTSTSTTKDNLSHLLDDADEDVLEDIFYYIVGRIGTIRARKLVDRKEKGMTTLELETFYHKQKNTFWTETSVSEDIDKVKEMIAQAFKFTNEVEKIHSETYSKILDSFCTPKGAMHANYEEEVRQGPKCKGCGYVLYSNAAALSDLCEDCEEDDDDRKCAGCGFVFRNPNVEWDLCETCDEDRADIVKKLDDELDEYVSKRVE